MIERHLKISESRSFFLFGARGTGKSTFLRQWAKDRQVLWLDLLSPEVEDRYARHPQLLSEQLDAASPVPAWVVIDEIQKVPRLLDVVHGEIEKRSIRFALTGSSARKLKRGSVNLLAGRAFVYNLFPFTQVELGDRFDLLSALSYGTLPGHLDLTDPDDKADFLRAYSLTYLKEEIWAEQFIRKLDPFRAFLEVAGQCNGELINYTNIARDVGVDIKTIQSYFQILEDTLVGYILEPYHRSVRKRQVQAPRFYFFDNGVSRALANTLNVPLQANTYAYGRAFEHFVVTESIRRNHYLRRDFKFTHLRTKDGAEVDLVIERPGAPTVLVEIKSSVSVDERSIRALRRFLADLPNTEGLCLSLDPIEKKIGEVRLVPWLQGLEDIGLGF